MAAVSEKHSPIHVGKREAKKELKSGVSAPEMTLSPDLEVAVTPYTAQEVQTVTEFYAARGLFNAAPLSRGDLVKLKLRSGNLPGRVFQNAADLTDTPFIPDVPMDPELRQKMLDTLHRVDPEGDAFGDRADRAVSDEVMKVVLAHTEDVQVVPSCQQLV